MTNAERRKVLKCAIEAAHAAGAVMKKNLNAPKRINSKTQHDIKLELDVRCQALIEKKLAVGFPKIALLGEEGIVGDPEAAERWVVDPIDGTVNFTFGIPHACVSIAMQARTKKGDFETVVGVVYDPFCDELWTAIRGEPARLNSKLIRVSQHTALKDAIVSIGFAKSLESVRQSLPYFSRLVPKIRKIRMMGSAALAMVYVASGRFDAYVERGISIWDVAAGGLIVECAGGEFWHEAIPGHYALRMITTNGKLRKKLEAV